jgi:hypothetical protein
MAISLLYVNFLLFSPAVYLNEDPNKFYSLKMIDTPLKFPFSICKF